MDRLRGSAVSRGEQELVRDEKRKRFDLFLEEDQNHLAKKTETQKSIEERDSWVKPMTFSSVNKSDPWYLRKPTGKDSQNHRSEDPMNSFNPKSSKAHSKSTSSAKDLRTKRMEREAREREKAASLLEKHRRLT